MLALQYPDGRSSDYSQRAVGLDIKSLSSKGYSSSESAEGYRRRTSANLLAALVALSTNGAQAHIRWDLATGIQKYGEESKPLKKVMPVKFITSPQAT
jgi:hypothetical protein